MQIITVENIAKSTRCFQLILDKNRTKSVHAITIWWSHYLYYRIWWLNDSSSAFIFGIELWQKLRKTSKKIDSSDFEKIRTNSSSKQLWTWTNHTLIFRCPQHSFPISREVQSKIRNISSRKLSSFIQIWHPEKTLAASREETISLIVASIISDVERLDETFLIESHIYSRKTWEFQITDCRQKLEIIPITTSAMDKIPLRFWLLFALGREERFPKCRDIY